MGQHLLERIHCVMRLEDRFPGALIRQTKQLAMLNLDVQLQQRSLATREFHPQRDIGGIENSAGFQALGAEIVARIRIVSRSRKLQVRKYVTRWYGPCPRRLLCT